MEHFVVDVVLVVVAATLFAVVAFRCWVVLWLREARITASISRESRNENVECEILVISHSLVI